MKLFVCGFSGAGKTTFGNKLAKDSSYQVLDLDEEVYERMGAGFDNLAQYIEDVGIENFRLDELDMLRLLDQNFKDNYLIILGGGALETKEIRDYISSVNGKLIHLHEEFEVCWQRISKAGDRPLAKKGRAFMEKLYESRSKLYQDSDFTFTASDLERVTSFEALLDELQKI